MISGYNHTGFIVSDLKRSVKFYTDLIGMKLLSNAGRPEEYVEAVTKISQAMQIAYMQGYGITLELIEYVGSKKKEVLSSVDNIGSGHICFNTPDINTLVTNLKQKGVRFLGEPVVCPGGKNKGGLVIYALDPDGIVIEFIQPPFNV